CARLLTAESGCTDIVRKDPARYPVAMLSKVAVVLSERLAMFEFGVVCEVFGLDRTADGLPGFDFKVCGAEPGKPLPATTPGISVTPEYGLEELAKADLVAIPAFPA